MVFLIESSIQNNKNILYLFSRNKDGNKTIKKINFAPYLYIKQTNLIPNIFKDKIINVVSGFKSITNKPVKKVIVNNTYDIYKLKKCFKETFEADINLPNRYIIDKIGVREPEKLRILYFDIETDDSLGFPDVEKPQEPVISISFIDNFTNNKIKLLYKHKNSIFNTNDSNTLVFKTEKKLLKAFCNIIIKYDPDIISGWYSKGFDLPYLIRRMDLLGIDYSNISPIKSISFNNFNEVNIKGRIHIDMLEAYKHFRRITNQGIAESYSLEYTSQTVLGEGKIEHLESFNQLWKNNPKKLLEYNIKDVELVKRINEKFEIIDFFNVIVCRACSQLSSIYHSSTLVDNTILNTYHNKYVFPSKKTNEYNKFSGAFVYEPTPGLYENVVVFDIASMYPSIIQTFNIGYETFNPNGKIKINDSIGFDEGNGIMKSILTELRKERTKYKKLMYKAQNSNNEKERKLYYYKQWAIKTLSNSVYGFLGFTKSRLYKREIAESVTIIGQAIIKWSIDFIEKKGFKTIYTDTDSIMFSIDTNNKIEMFKIARQALKELNESFNDFVEQFGVKEHIIEMEFEKVFKKILFVPKKNSKNNEGAKKKYAYIPLWFDDKTATNEISYSGFATKRSDTPRIIRELQKNVLKAVLNNKSKDYVLALCKKLSNDLLNNNIPDEEFGFPGAINKSLDTYGNSKTDSLGKIIHTGTPPIIFAVKYSNLYLGTNFKEGDKPKWVYVKNVPSGFPKTHVIAFDYKIPNGFVVDWKLMFERFFYDILNPIFLSVGWGTFPDLLENSKGLSEWC